MSLYHSGQRVRITSTGEPVVIWDAAPGPGNYWAHLVGSREMVLIHVQQKAGVMQPVVTIQEEWP